MTLWLSSRLNLCTAALRELQRHPPEMEQNVTLQIVHCPCGEHHVQIVLVKPGIEGDILVPESFGDPKIFVQFDGSAHHDYQIGGAGAGLFEISSYGLQLLDWGCLALPFCKDNIVAEVMGADLALRLYERMLTYAIIIIYLPNSLIGFKVTLKLWLTTYSSKVDFVDQTLLPS